MCGVITTDETQNLWSLLIFRIGCLHLPFINIFIFTVLILVFLRRARKHRSEVQHQECKINFQLTIMLIGVAISFLVLRLPYLLTYQVCCGCLTRLPFNAHCLLQVHPTTYNMELSLLTVHKRTNMAQSLAYNHPITHNHQHTKRNFLI